MFLALRENKRLFLIDRLALLCVAVGILLPFRKFFQFQIFSYFEIGHAILFAVGGFILLGTGLVKFHIIAWKDLSFKNFWINQSIILISLCGVLVLDKLWYTLSILGIVYDACIIMIGYFVSFASVKKIDIIHVKKREKNFSDTTDNQLPIKSNEQDKLYFHVYTEHYVKKMLNIKDNENKKEVFISIQENGTTHSQEMVVKKEDATSTDQQKGTTLCQETEDKKEDTSFHTFAIIGNYGTGKSSFANLMWNDFKKEATNTVRVTIESWGIPSGNIMQYILREIQKELSKYAETVYLNGIDENYQNIASFSNSWIAAVFPFFRDKRSQEDMIQQLDAFMSSIGKKMFLVIEDIDRIKSDDVVISSICAFMDKIKITKNIYAIITIHDNKQIQRIIRCCVDDYLLIPNLEIIKTEIILFIDKHYSKDILNNKESNRDIKDKLYDCIISNLKSMREYITFKNKITIDWSHWVNNISFIDWCIYQIMLISKAHIEDSDKSAYSFLTSYISVYQDIGKINTLIIERKTNNTDVSNKEQKLLNLLSEEQFKLIDLLSFIAIGEKDGQHILSSEYSNYWNYLSSGICNIKGIPNTYFIESRLIKILSSFNIEKKFNSNDLTEFLKYIEIPNIHRKIKQFYSQITFSIDSIGPLIIVLLQQKSNHMTIFEEILTHLWRLGENNNQKLIEQIDIISEYLFINKLVNEFCCLLELEYKILNERNKMFQMGKQISNINNPYFMKSWIKIMNSMLYDI